MTFCHSDVTYHYRAVAGSSRNFNLLLRTFDINLRGGVGSIALGLGVLRGDDVALGLAVAAKFYIRLESA